MTRIVLIGPVRPYRGGIAQYTEQLHETLSQSDEVLTISYSRQYPSFIYPGGSDKGAFPHDYLPDVEYLIDAANPLSWRAVGRRIEQFRPDMIIVQWWHIYWAPMSIWARRLADRIGARIIMICHNVDDHETSGWKRRIRDAVFRSYPEFLVHSGAQHRLLQERFPRADVRMHPIPAYGVFPQPDTKLPRRAGTEFLFFGLIRPYKGLDVLLRALASLRGRDFHLTIAGEAWTGAELYLRLIEDGGIARQVEFVNSYVSDQQAANYFARADAVVLPYRSASGSAVASLAFRYDKPVIASDIGGLPDFVLPGSGRLVTPGDVDALATALESAMTIPDWFDPSAIEWVNQQLTWAGLAAQLTRV